MIARTAFDELDRLCDNRTLIDIDTNNLRDNLTTFLQWQICSSDQRRGVEEVHER